VAVQGSRVGGAQLAGARPHLRKRALGHSEQGAQLRVPVTPGQVEQKRPGGVGGVGDVLAGELEDQPGVDRPEHSAPVAGAFGEAVHVAEQPLDLGPGEVRVEHQPRALAHQRLVPRRTQLVAPRRRATVLPDERAMQRLARVRVPHGDGLTLVGDPDRLQLTGAHARRVQHLARHRLRDVPDLARVVLDPAGPRKVLLELPIGASRQPGVLVEHQAGGAGGALIDGEDHPGDRAARR
jgi:hypothetical protein